jgi:hypothetical protein
VTDWLLVLLVLIAAAVIGGALLVEVHRLFAHFHHSIDRLRDDMHDAFDDIDESVARLDRTVSRDA